jgi:hypothetical protein
VKRIHGCEELLRGFMSGDPYRHGLIWGADDRGDPVIQLSPPLIADIEEFEPINTVLRQVLTDAWIASSNREMRTMLGAVL